MRAFPHPHFDKQIPDQQVVMLERLHCTKEQKSGGKINIYFSFKEPQPRGSKNNSGGNYLYLR